LVQLASDDVRKARLQARDLAPARLQPVGVGTFLVPPLLGDELSYLVDQATDLRAGVSLPSDAPAVNGAIL
jgi:hypothetical protein